MAFDALEGNLARVREDIARVKAKEGLVHDVTIVAVTKGHDVEAVRAAHRAGLHDVGENRVQEASEKMQQAGGLPLRWHLIGHLQTNKARFAAGVFVLIHSVDSWRV